MIVLDRFKNKGLGGFKMLRKKITKQEHLENELDNLTPGMVASIALSSRQVCNDWKVNSFIKGFTNSIGLYFKDDLLYIDIARRILGYLYPENRAYWSIQDDLFKEQYNNSCIPGLIKSNKGRF